jgi:S1-C subfamily serine protease
MTQVPQDWIIRAIALVLWLSCVCQFSPAFAQRVSKDDAALIVDGVVQKVFSNSGQPQAEKLVQIEVRQSSARRAAPPRAHFPAPGEIVYVHVFPQPQAALFSKPEGSGAVPQERAQIRAYLVAREDGTWEGASSEWFEQSSAGTAPASPIGPAPSVAGSPGSGGSSVASLGMTFEPHKVNDRLVLRVKSVERGGAAQQAGIEVGDVIIGVKEAPLQSATQLEELARRGEPLSLMVVDVNTSRPTRIELRPGQQSDAQVSAEPTTTPSQRRSLGLMAEPVRLGQRTALKVVRVEPGSAAQKAGIEPDDILVAANGAPLTGPEQLGNALRKSGPTLTLTVRDSRSGKDVPVEVVIGGPADQTPLPADASAISPSTGALGAVTELSFYDVEVALKVTEVEPGSAAARAGLQPGYLIVAANGKPVLHPSELNDLVRNSTGPLRLTVVDPRTNAKNNVQVNLSR